MQYALLQVNAMSTTQSMHKLPGAPIQAHGALAEISIPGEARIGPLFALPGLLEHMKVDPRQVLRQAGIAPQVFDNPENRLSHESVV